MRLRQAVEQENDSTETTPWKVGNSFFTVLNTQPVDCYTGYCIIYYCKLIYSNVYLLVKQSGVILCESYFNIRNL